MVTFDLEEEIFKNVDQDPKESVPKLLKLIEEKVNASEAEARNMLIYSQQAVIRSLHHKVGMLIELKQDEKEAFIGEFSTVAVNCKVLVALLSPRNNPRTDGCQPPFYRHRN